MITADMTIASVMKLDPHVAPVFMSYGMHCLYCPHGAMESIADACKDEDFLVIYHNCGNAIKRQVPQILSTGCAAYHFGNAVDMSVVMAQAPSDILCMGNVDPAAQFVQGTPESMSKAVADLLEKCGNYPNFVISSGCDIPFHAKWENIQAFFEAVK